MIEKIYPWENSFVRVEHPTRIGARDCVVKNLELEETIDFLNKYHFQKSCHGQIVRLGLVFNGILIGVMTFGRARFTKKVQWELLRLCYHPGYLVTGGSERLFSQFLKEHSPNSIISYCDKSKFSGNVYLKLGMKKIQVGRPRKHFWRDFDKRHIDSKLLSMFGADKLLGIKYGKGSNNEEVLLKEGFEIIKDEGQDAYLYLDDSRFFGYIYMTTDAKTKKKYIGQHINNTFDPNYFGSGQIITNILKNRPNDLTVELIEWCKQDISERETFYIEKYNTLYPNGYNLTVRKQWFSFNESDSISHRVKSFWDSEKGSVLKEENSRKMKEFYSSSKGKETMEQITAKRMEYFKTDEGKEKQKERIERYEEFCQTDSGKEMCQKRNEKIKQFNLTDEGKSKKEERIQALKDFYSTEEGKKTKALQVMKFKENLKRKDYQERRKIGDKKRSEWAKTEDGKRKIEIATKQRVNNMVANYISKVNAMSEEEWNDFLKKHPRTTLKKYRK